MRAGGVGAPMPCLCTTPRQDGLTARLLVVLSGRAAHQYSDARTARERARGALLFAHFATLGQASDMRVTS
jgi:hypothetical protein